MRKFKKKEQTNKEIQSFEVVIKEPLEKEVDDLTQNKKSLEVEIWQIQNEIKTAREELKKIEQKKGNRTKDLDEKERQLNARQENVAGLEAKEKRVMGLAATLQKHFDKMNMPIKVFE